MTSKPTPSLISSEYDLQQRNQQAEAQRQAEVLRKRQQDMVLENLRGDPKYITTIQGEWRP